MPRLYREARSLNSILSGSVSILSSVLINIPSLPFLHIPIAPFQSFANRLPQHRNFRIEENIQTQILSKSIAQRLRRPSIQPRRLHFLQDKSRGERFSFFGANLAAIFEGFKNHVLLVIFAFHHTRIRRGKSVVHQSFRCFYLVI